MRRNVAEVRAAFEVMPPGTPEAAQTRMRQLVAVVADVERQTNEQVKRLLEFFPRGLAAASEDLYFPGQERYG
jgi:hypothetical protein